MGLWQMLELFAYIFILFVLMPLLLLGAGRFAKFCAQRKSGPMGFQAEKPLKPDVNTNRA